MLGLNYTSGAFEEMKLVNVYGAASSSKMPRREIIGSLRSRSRSRSRVNGALDPEVKIKVENDAHLKPVALAQVQDLEQTQPNVIEPSLIEQPEDELLTTTRPGRAEPAADLDEDEPEEEEPEEEEPNVTEPEDEEPEPHLTDWKLVHSLQGKRAYLTAIFAEDHKKHHVVEVSEKQTADYYLAVTQLLEQAILMNYTKEATVDCRNRLLRERHWSPGVTSARPAADSTPARPAADSTPDLD